MKLIAIVATDGVEYSELTEPRNQLRDAGHEVHVLAPNAGFIQGKDDTERIEVDLEIIEADPLEYDAVVLPGGVKNPDTLRTNEVAVTFIKHFVNTKKPIAAICHGLWTLINADGVEGKTVTSWPSLKTDLENAGAKWVDEEVVVDENLVTSRKLDDIPAFVSNFKEILSA